MSAPPRQEGVASVLRLRAWKLAVAGPSVYWYFPVFYALLTSVPTADPVGLTALFVVMMVSASWGFLLNDLADRRSDAASGRADAIHGHALSERSMAALVLATGGLSWAVVFVIPGGYIFKVVLALNYLVSILYSVPPAKLKVRRFWGFLANSLMERPLPVLVFLSYMNYYRMETVILPVFMELTWSVFKHQAADVRGDLQAGVHTFAAYLGEERSNMIVHRLLNPLSVFSLLFLVALTWLNVVGMRLLSEVVFLVILVGAIGAYSGERLGKVGYYVTPTDPPYIIFLNISYRFVLLPALVAGVLLYATAYAPLLALLTITLAYQALAYASLLKEARKAKALPK